MGLSWESLGTGREDFNRETRCHSLSDVFLILDIRNVCIYIYIYLTGVYVNIYIYRKEADIYIHIYRYSIY